MLSLGQSSLPRFSRLHSYASLVLLRVACNFGLGDQPYLGPKVDVVNVDIRSQPLFHSILRYPAATSRRKYCRT